MMTPSHIIISAALFARPGAPLRNAAALAGGVLPDVSLYALAGWAIWVRGVPPQVVFDEYYFSRGWQSVFAVDNSFVLWGLALLAALAFRHRVLAVLCGAAMIHLATDFPLHHDDARAQFWPLSNWVFESPVSYWDPQHYGKIASMIELGLIGALLVILAVRFKGLVVRGLLALAAISLVLPGLLFRLLLH